MKKFVLLSGFLLASMGMNANDFNTIPSSDDDVIARKAAIAYNTQIYNAKIIKIQLKQASDLNQSIRLLNRLQKIVTKMEKSVNY